ncbi:CBS domain-containing protein [Qingshengfaniella alkalisoli]|uniref:CBS domain-containing protein n=1 Tax=Qingshengfaniella alkalisoli TaxID=2599296 RepID=A0A5B8ISB3_9RHOB|nr:CBS domain-containing protein [Qingshengfaniella alkalisoli]QDY69102.1 CBS domain-containing protein [Qingshengfaniella alkalisoli]
MRVHQILRTKSDDGVVTIEPDARIADAAALLSSRRIGAVVVSPDGKKAVGILSERDIVRELGQRGPVCLEDTVDKLMTQEVISCKREDMSAAVFRLMTDGRFRHLPVIEDGEMVGLISIGDVVKAQLSELEMEKDALQGMIMGH